MSEASDLQCLERQYQSFLLSHGKASNPTHVEYIGVNFFQKEDEAPVWKAYYTTEESLPDVPPLLQPLIDRRMIRALNKIDDTIHHDCIRYEIGLACRTNENMKWLYQWLFSLYPELENKITELHHLSRLPCCSLPEYQYAAMYFLGMISGEQVNAVKLHYLLRLCKDSDKIGKNYVVRNRESLDALRGTGVPALVTLTECMSNLLEHVELELWMAAVDYFRDSAAKYKIYAKKYSAKLYGCLSTLMERYGCDRISKQVHTYQEWIAAHPELEQYGFALCLTEDGQWSLNFYH